MKKKNPDSKKYRRAYAPLWEAVKQNLVVEIACEHIYYTRIKEMLSLEKHLDESFKGNKYQKRLHFVPKYATVEGEKIIVGMIIRLVDRRKIRLDDL